MPYWGAGIGAYAASMARAWAAAGHEVHLLTADHESLRAEGLKKAAGRFPGVTLHVCGALQSESDRDSCVMPVHKRAMTVFRTLDRLHLERAFDYIEFPDYFAEGYFSLRARHEQGKFLGDGSGADGAGSLWGVGGGAGGGGGGAAVLGVRLHTPTVLARELNLESNASDEVATLEKMEASAIRDADLVISPTRALLEWTREHLEIAPGAITDVVPYPFDSSTRREMGGERAGAVQASTTAGPALPPLKHEGQEGEGKIEPVRTVLYFGRIEKRKGVENLIDAGRRLVDTGTSVRFVLIGGDTQTGPGASESGAGGGGGGAGTSMVTHLRSRVINMKAGRFVFEPARSRAALGDAIRAADVVCLPSLWENFPNACVEAMALGACVVGSDKGGMGEIIRDGVDGFLFDGGNTSNLGEVLKRVLADPQAREAVRSQAPKRIAELCDPARIVRKTVHAVERARKLVNARAREESAATLAQRHATLEVPIVRVEPRRGVLSGLLGRFRRG